MNYGNSEKLQKICIDFIAFIARKKPQIKFCVLKKLLSPKPGF